MKQPKHLYVITRKDLSPGYQGVQGMHALVEFSAKFPELYLKWYKTSNYLCFLSVWDEKELKALARKAMKLGVMVSTFHEPDVNFEMTAIVLEVGSKSMKITKKLTLALKEWP